MRSMAKESNITHLDKFGRIKLSASFRRAVEETSENEVFDLDGRKEPSDLSFSGLV